jgi:hypothetical protein
MEVIGKIKVINAEQQVSASFRKRELVVETSEEYPQFISINFIQDKCDVLNGYNVGQEVKVGINLRGREWVNPQGETKYFNDIQGWRVEKLEANNAKEYEVKNPTYEPANLGAETENPDLPF